jgi:hypothetical protein
MRRLASRVTVLPVVRYPESVIPPPCFPLGLSIGLEFVVVLLLVDALVGGGGALLLELLAHGAMDLFFEDGLGLDRLELGLEVLHDEGGRVAATAGVRHVRVDVFDLVAGCAPGVRCQHCHWTDTMGCYSPIALAAAALLGFGGVGISVSCLGKVLGKTVLTLGSAISNAGVVTVSELVGTSHCLTLAYDLKPGWLTQLKQDGMEQGILECSMADVNACKKNLLVGLF